MKRVGMRRGVRGLVLVTAIVGLLTVALAAQASACFCIAPSPHFVGGASKQANPNNTITANVSGVVSGDTLAVSVATGTFGAPPVTCSDSGGNTYTIAADKNVGSGRLFVCSSKVTVAPTTVTANYPGFSGLSVINVVAIPGVATPPGPNSTNSGSNPTVNSGSITVGGEVLLFGVVANGNVSSFTADSPWVQLPAQAGGAGAGMRTVTPAYRVVGPGTYALTGTPPTGGLSGSGFWQAAIIAYQELCV